ncbi:MAG: glycine--tRNA ligase subunit beta [Deltaproteobacteria bacterium]|nr:glycine--tRNA ligase subunit beta [Deltaproteobacteria bacterium]
MGSGIAENQDDQVLEVTGPPKKVAFDAEGNPTKAALGFAAKQGITVEEIGFIETHLLHSLAQVHEVGIAGFCLCQAHPLDRGPVRREGGAL